MGPIKPSSTDINLELAATAEDREGNAVPAVVSMEWTTTAELHLGHLTDLPTRPFGALRGLAHCWQANRKRADISRPLNLMLLPPHEGGQDPQH